MIRIIISSLGEILMSISGDPSMVEINTPADALYVDVEELPNRASYWDFESHSFIAMGISPTTTTEFDYSIKQWVDSRSLDEIKNQKWEQIKLERDLFEFGGFEFESNIYDSDQVSQGRIMGAAIAGIDQIWTLANNTTVDLTASQLQQQYASLQAHIASAHERGRIRQLIYEAETREQVEAVNF